MPEERFVSLAEALGLIPPRDDKPPVATRRSIRQMCREILNSHEYLEHVQRMIVTDTLPPQIEQMLYHYAEGKPVERVEYHESPVALDDLSVDQLEDKLDDLHKRVKMLRKMEDGAAEDVTPASKVH